MRASTGSNRPLYRVLVDDISARIVSGNWRVGDKLPSERGLCELYRVSQITVRRALRELGLAGYVYSQHGLGWYVADRSSAAAAHRAVTLIAPELDLYATQLVPRLAGELSPDLALQVAFMEGGPGTCELAVSRAVDGGSAAVLLAITGEERRLPELYGAALARADVPVVLLWRSVPEADAPAAILDEAGAVQRLTEHLLGLGHRRLAYVGDDPTQIEGQRRYYGFANAIWERGQELPLEWVFAGQLIDRPDGERFRRMMGEPDHPTAVVCGSDYRASEALTLLSQDGVSCPEEVAVVGLGDAAFAPLLCPPLTSFRFDMSRLAGSLAGMLRALVLGQQVESVTVSGEIIQRKSCGAQR